MTVKFKLYYILLTKQPIPQLVWKSKKLKLFLSWSLATEVHFQIVKGDNKRVKIDNVWCNSDCPMTNS
jgi:hypothetical protein